MRVKPYPPTNLDREGDLRLREAAAKLTPRRSPLVFLARVNAIMTGPTERDDVRVRVPDQPQRKRLPQEPALRNQVVPRERAYIGRPPTHTALPLGKNLVLRHSWRYERLGWKTDRPVLDHTLAASNLSHR